MAVVPRKRACECCRNHSITRTNDHSSTSSLGHGENRRLKKTESLREDDGITERNCPLVSRAAQVTSALASRLVATDSHSSGVAAKPPINRPMPMYPPYNYADNIPKPKVIYIKNEEVADEMVASLNG
jgi:hypothetical protein